MPRRPPYPIQLQATAIEVINPKILAVHLGWARLLVDRYRDLVEIPASNRKCPGGDHHHFAPDGEGAPEYENYHSPDHTH